MNGICLVLSYFMLLCRFYISWQKKANIPPPILLFVVGESMLFVNHTFMQECILVRLLIFSFGIYCFFCESSWNNKIGKVGLLFILSLFFIGFTISHTVGFLNYFYSPVIILFIIMIPDKIWNLINPIISKLGKYTLEIYVANCMVLSVVSHFEGKPLLSYFLFTIIFTPSVIIINSFFLFVTHKNRK